MCSLGAGLAAAGRQDTAPHTRVVKYSAPAALPDRARPGTCSASSAAGYRADAFACVSEKTTFDPCFATPREHHVLCGVDPRQPSSGVLVAMTAASPTAAPAPAVDSAAHGRHHTWFFELSDGSACQPLAKPRQLLDGAIELYSCRFGAAGEADAVLGDLDDSAALWTISKVLINKKVEPQTIKSLMVAPVKTVWQ